MPAWRSLHGAASARTDEITAEATYAEARADAASDFDALAAVQAVLLGEFEVEEGGSVSDFSLD